MHETTTPLHLACYNGHVYVAEKLLDHGAQANAEDIRSQTPLHQVLLGHHNHANITDREFKIFNRRYLAPRLAQKLLECGADVNAQNKDHETPLHLTVRHRLPEMAQFLLEHGADVNAKNSRGKSPLQFASGRKRREMKRMLLEYSSKQT
jgi:ankyrin repeat protein